MLPTDPQRRFVDPSSHSRFPFLSSSSLFCFGFISFFPIFFFFLFPSLVLLFFSHFRALPLPPSSFLPIFFLLHLCTSPSFLLDTRFGCRPDCDSSFFPPIPIPPRPWPVTLLHKQPSSYHLRAHSLSGTATAAFDCHLSSLQSRPSSLILRFFLPPSPSSPIRSPFPPLRPSTTFSPLDFVQGARDLTSPCHAQDFQFYGPGPSWLGANDAHLWHVSTAYRHDFSLSPSTAWRAAHDSSDRHRPDRQSLVQRALLLDSCRSRRRRCPACEPWRPSTLDLPRGHSRRHPRPPASGSREQCRRPAEIVSTNHRKQ